TVNFFAGQLLSRLLFLLELLAFGQYAVVLAPGLFVTHKRIDALTNRAHVGLVEDRLAKFLRFADHRALFDHCFHKRFRLLSSAGIRCRWRVRITIHHNLASKSTHCLARVTSRTVMKTARKARGSGLPIHPLTRDHRRALPAADHPTWRGNCPFLHYKSTPRPQSCLRTRSRRVPLHLRLVRDPP